MNAIVNAKNFAALCLCMQTVGSISWDSASHRGEELDIWGGSGYFLRTSSGQPDSDKCKRKAFGIHMSARHDADVQLSPMLRSWLSCLPLHLARRSLRLLLTRGLGDPWAPQSGWTPGLPEIHSGILWHCRSHSHALFLEVALESILGAVQTVQAAERPPPNSEK